jgi:protocatechuate 3,4-dioxygenase beta subunit
LTLHVSRLSGTTATPISGARVDVWQTDAIGVYSDEASQGTTGQTFLRGFQFTDANGDVTFTTIYPGWYPGRTPHIHFKVFLDAANLVTGQLYFPDDLSARIYAGVAPYNDRKAKRDIVANAEDFIFEDQGGAETLVSVTEEGGSYLASLVIGVDRAG